MFMVLTFFKVTLRFDTFDSSSPPTELHVLILKIYTKLFLFKINVLSL